MNADVAGDVLAEIEGRAEAATPGPWVHNGVNGIHARIGACVAISHVHEDQRRWEDAVFIAAARTDVPRMAEALRWALSALDELADRGLGFDLNPTTDGKPASYVRYIGRMDDSAREVADDARKAITAALGCEAGK